MHNNFYKIIKSYIFENKSTNILILDDSYFSELPFKNKREKIEIEKIKNEFKEKNFDIIYTLSDFKKLNKKYDLIINIFFSSKTVNQISFTNKILDLSLIRTEYIFILPFIGFVNYGLQNFNPILFNAMNKNNNFDLKEISFLSTIGQKLKIDERFQDKIFFQSTSKKNQNFTDLVYNELLKKYYDCSILFRTVILNTKIIDLEYFEPYRLEPHLSGHGNKTWIDEGALNTIIRSKKIKTLVDVGCGPGGLVDFTNKIGINSLGIDGDNSIIRSNKESFKIHDFTKGYFETNQNFDLGWCVEFLEHVDEIFSDNYFNLLKKCKYVFCTYAPLGKKGYHHVNTQNQDYWVKKFDINGFKLNQELTFKIRKSSTIEKNFIRDYGLFFENSNF